MKTLTDLKKDLYVGRKVKLLRRYGKEVNSLRIVDKVQSNSIRFRLQISVLNRWLDYPKSSLLEYEGNSVKIYAPGLREFTPEEKKSIEGEPKDPEQDRIDILTDGSSMFYRRKRYYKEKGMEYLGPAAKKSKGMIRKGNKVLDDRIKGKLILEYELL